MMHVILSESYQQGRELALSKLGIDPHNITCGIGVAVIYADEHYMRLSTISRDPNMVKIHDLVPPTYYPKVRNLLKMKGLL